MTVGNDTVLTLSRSSEIERPNSPDVLLGAYLVSHLRQHCENCGTLHTPQWRKGWHSEVLNHSVLLCNACGLKFHKNQFCPYCKFVYSKEQKINNTWLTCEYCARWVHCDCETKHGGFENSQPYACPDCRNGTTPISPLNIAPVYSPVQELSPETNPETMDTEHHNWRKPEEMEIESVEIQSIVSHHAPSHDQQSPI
jgi:hypothetical protein